MPYRENYHQKPEAEEDKKKKKKTRQRKGKGEANRRTEKESLYSIVYRV